MKKRLGMLVLVVLAAVIIPGVAHPYLEGELDPEADSTDPTWFVEDQVDQSGGAPSLPVGSAQLVPAAPIGGKSPHGCRTRINYPHMSTAVPGAASENGQTNCRTVGATNLYAWVKLLRQINGSYVGVGDRDGVPATKNFPNRRVTATSKENPCRHGGSYAGIAYGQSISYLKLYVAFAASSPRTIC
jgi:hypothetical protein